MGRSRGSALLPFAFAVVSFSLTIVFVVAGRDPGVLENQFIISVNATRVGQDIIRFERANAAASGGSPTTSATPTSSSNPLDILNPFSPSNPLNPSNPDSPLSGLGDMLDPIVGNITDQINDGLEGAVNGVVERIVDSAGIKDMYYLFLQKVCSGNIANGTSGNADGIKVERCESYDDASESLNNLAGSIQSSVVIANTNISIPLVSELTGSLGSLSGTLSSLRKLALAAFIISLIGSALSAVLSIPAIILTKSRLLVYLNMFWPILASTFAFLGAILLTIAIVGLTQIAGGFGNALNLFFKQGSHALLFVWLGWLFISLASAYWVTVWFVEVRTWRIVAKRREEEKKGNWGGLLGRFKKSTV